MQHSLAIQPLYQQVYDCLAARISEGYWKPTEQLPSESALAFELGVSQGTVRKALTKLETEQLLERHQGKGTSVCAFTDEGSNFRFFRLTRRDGTRLTPEGKVESIVTRMASIEERSDLELSPQQQVIELQRIRLVDCQPCALEKIVLPHSQFTGIETLHSLDESLYPLYQRKFGIHIASTEEKLGAISASQDEASRLQLPEGTALLRVERVALTIQKTKAELRTTLFDTRNFIYTPSH